MGTTLLRSGKIVDGTGNQAFDGSVLLDGDRIRAVFKQDEEIPLADTVIDVSGCVVSPGFIDMHSHMDCMLPLDDHPIHLKCMLEQGITTVVGGNCGISPAPVTTETFGLLDNFAVYATCMEKALDYTWQSMDEFLNKIEKRKPIVNLAQLVGHGTVRITTSNTRRGAMNPDELKNSLDTVQQSLDEGACGLSFGLGYEPGMLSTNEEVEAFSKVTAQANKPVAVHLRTYAKVSPFYPPQFLKPNYTPHNLRALKEMIDIARRTGVKLQISHLMLVGRKTWPLASECLSMIEDACNEGIDIMLDAFPYTFGNTTAALFSPWLIKKLPEGYKSWRVYARFRFELKIGLPMIGWSFKDYQLMDAAVEGWEDLNGLTIDVIAREWKTSPAKVLLGLCESSKERAIILYHALSGEPGNEKALDAIVSNDLCLFESDVLIRNTQYPNPAALGNFPKILGEYVRDRKLFSIENAIHRMTAASADRFGLSDRGVLHSGKAADVVVFDPLTISETPPTNNKPAGKPKGIKHVFVNGMQVVKEGTYLSGACAGSVLRT